MRLFLFIDSVSALQFLIQFHHPVENTTYTPTRNTSKYLQEINAQHARFKSWLTNQSESIQLSANYPPYTSLFSGLVVEAENEASSHPGMLGAVLKSFAEVRAVFPVKTLKAPTYTIQPQNSQSNLQRRDLFANNMTGILDYTSSDGTGVKVCTIDSGVDYTHPALGGCFGEGCKVAFGYDFAGDSFNPPLFTTPNPKNDPKDCYGHGTHVAGIIAASPIDPDYQFAVGVAPGVTLGAYKVFGCSGSTTFALVISALDQAFQDGCSIVNLSVGTGIGGGLENSPDVLEVDKLASFGMIVISAAGNDQNLGLFRVAAPGIAQRSIAVGAVENIMTLGRTFRVFGESVQIPFDYSGTPPAASADLKLKASEPLTDENNSDGCTAYAKDFFKGCIALIRRGTCLFSVKATNAGLAGARMVIFYNSEPGSIGNVESSNLTTLNSALTISGTAGSYLISLLSQKGNGNIALEFDQADRILKNPNGGQMSLFSSWGLGNHWEIKPDLVAPGGHIFSTYPMSMGGYAVLSGTSMATPHATGIYALILSNPLAVSKNMCIINTLLQTTGVPVKLPNSTILASTALQGSGLINLHNFTSATSIIFPATLSPKISIWDNSSDGVAPTQIFTIFIENQDSEPRIYKFGHVDASYVDIRNLSAPTMYNPRTNTESLYATISLPEKPVLVLSNDNEQVTIDIRGPSRRGMAVLDGGSLAWLYSGWITIEDDVGRIYNIAYGGYVGEKNRVSPIDLVTFPPYLSTMNNRNYTSMQYHVNATLPSITDLSEGRSATILKQDAVLFNLHMNLPSINSVLYIFPSSTDKNTAISISMNAFKLQSVRINTTQLHDGIQAIREAESGFGQVLSQTPPECAAMSQSVEIAVSDLDNSQGNLYAPLLWDGSVNFNGFPPYATDGDYFGIVLSEGVFGEFGNVSLWISPIFSIQRSR